MDADAIKMLSDLLSKGGSVALMVIVWVAYKAGATAQEAVRALTDIRKTIARSERTVTEIAEDVQSIDRRTQSMETASGTNGMKLDALIARNRAS